MHGLFSDEKSEFKATLQVSTDEKQSKTSAYNGETAKITLSSKKDSPNAKVLSFMKRALKSTFIVHNVSDKISFRGPSAPFTTSTVQQEAYRKFGMPIKRTMDILQILYQNSLITYHRTDSVDISKQKLSEIKKTIEKKYGKEYYESHKYKSTNVHSQEAHEAICAVKPEVDHIETSDENQNKLYRLIWQRMTASQMAKAKINTTSIQIEISKYV